ncbi:hypothetical protein J1N35_011764 [Gossypium stocksii]|uniref:Reverse transcriptase zinc-binding domain-containing protein n=1 Tax=Gossypium stocksii TaxID=47602 RepID=A0A9D3W2Y9_9ROSI|nr:hypothetical protein J1N35_011764 [Gossypium stocksii]
MVNSDGSWNLEMFRIRLLEDIICRIISIPPPHPNAGTDRIIWARSASERTRWGIGHSNACTVCGHDFEYLLHVLRDCLAAKEVWMLMVPDQLKQRFFSVSFQDWLFLNLFFHERVQDRETTWSSLFGLIAWRIWKNRNLFIFQNISWDAMEVVKISSCWARQYETYLGGPTSNTPRANPTNNPDDTWVLLSSDGAVIRDSGFAASDGVIQDFNGKWIVGYTHFLGEQG